MEAWRPREARIALGLGLRSSDFGTRPSFGPRTSGFVLHNYLSPTLSPLVPRGAREETTVGCRYARPADPSECTGLPNTYTWLPMDPNIRPAWTILGQPSDITPIPLAPEPEVSEPIQPLGSLPPRSRAAAWEYDRQASKTTHGRRSRRLLWTGSKPSAGADQGSRTGTLASPCCRPVSN